MAITATGVWATASNSSAATSIANSGSGFNPSTGQDLLVCVAIAASGVTVSTITDSGSNSFSLKASSTNASGVRVELWQAANVTGYINGTVTVTVSGSSLLALAIQVYSGINHAGTQNSVGSLTGSSGIFSESLNVQDTGGVNVGAMAFACNSGDTFTALPGMNLRRSIVPSLTSVAVAIVDNGFGGSSTVPVQVQISASRQWAAAGLELRVSGSAATTWNDYAGALPVDGTPRVKDQKFYGNYRMPFFTSGATTVAVSNSGFVR